jgi:hypothetical protein
MRLAVVGFLAVMVAAPLAAQAAQPPARWAVTLRGTVTDSFEYSERLVEERCRVSRNGSGGRQLSFVSARPTRIQVSRVGQGTTYRPARLRAVRLTGGSNGGSSTWIRFCPGGPVETKKTECRAARSTPRLLRLGFTARPTTISFGRAAAQNVSVCGLGQTQAGGWLHLANARVDHDALVAGRSRRVVIRGSASEEVTSGGNSALSVTRKTTVRWTLTFRRIG